MEGIGARHKWLLQVDFLVNRLNALEEHIRSAEDQLALELDHRWRFLLQESSQDVHMIACLSACSHVIDAASNVLQAQ